MIDQWYTKTELQNKNHKIQNIPKHRLQIKIHSNKVIDFNKVSLAVSSKMKATQMEIFNFLWLTWDQ